MAATRRTPRKPKPAARKPAARNVAAARKTPKRVVAAARKRAAVPAKNKRAAASAPKAARRTATARATSAASPRPESLRDIRINVTTIGDLLLNAADRHPDRDALVFPGLRLTYVS